MCCESCCSVSQHGIIGRPSGIWQVSVNGGCISNPSWCGICSHDQGKKRIGKRCQRSCRLFRTVAYFLLFIPSLSLLFFGGVDLGLKSRRRRRCSSDYGVWRSISISRLSSLFPVIILSLAG